MITKLLPKGRWHEGHYCVLCGHSMSSLFAKPRVCPNCGDIEYKRKTCSRRRVLFAKAQVKYQDPRKTLLEVLDMFMSYSHVRIRPYDDHKSICVIEKRNKNTWSWDTAGFLTCPADNLGAYRLKEEL